MTTEYSIRPPRDWSPAADKRDYHMPYEYFRDEQTRILERTQPELIDMEVFYKAFQHTPKGADTWYLLNAKNRKLMDTQGMWRPPYYSYDHLEDAFSGQDAFVVCPGPSLADFDLTTLSGKLVLAVNSAGWKVDPLLWVLFESNFMLWFKDQNFPTGRDFIMTARCACRWRNWGLTAKTGNIYVPRFEEDRNMPGRVPAVTTMGAITTAWWLGARRVFVLGMDLSKPNKQPYIKGVPHSKFGAENPFDEQVRAIEQFSLPGVEILNASPYSSAMEKIPFTPTDYRAAERAARGAPTCQLPKNP